MLINFYALSAIINGISSAILGLFVFFKNKRSRINQIFSLFCLCIAFWSYAYLFWPGASDKISTLFWFQMLHLGAIFIPITYLHFVLIWLNLYEEKKIIVKLGYLAGFIISIFIPTSLFIKDMTPKLSFRYWGEPGILYHLFIILFLSYAIYAVYLLFRAYQKSIGIQRTQLKYILAGTIIGYLGGATNYPLWYNIPIRPIGTILVSVYIGFVTYAIVRYRLMDIRVVIKRGTVFSGLVVAITAIYVLFAFLIGWAFFGGAYTLKAQLVTGLIVATATAIGFRPLYDWLRKSTDNFLFKGTYNPQELLADISDVLSRTLDLDKVIKTLRIKIIKSFRIHGMKIVVLADHEDGRIGTKEELYKKKRQDIALRKIIDHFRKNRDVLILEELKKQYADKIKFDYSFLLIKDIETVKADLVMPLYIKDKLVGLFLLGKKRSSDMFSVEDIRTLETIASQSAIAIENACLYEEMKDFSRVLQREVERQTRSLREANEKLRQLDKAKSEFISLASHQLRTPLTAIKGYISMLLEGLWGELNEEQQEKMRRIFVSNERLIKLVEDLLMVSRIESGRLKFDFQELSLESLIESLIEEFSQTIESKKLYLKFNKPAKPLPQVNADSLKMRQVFQNLIDNAINYTKKGGITVDIKQEEGKVIVSVKDTGIGISVKEKSGLFQKFSRGKSGAKMFTEGTGLGLYLCEKIVRAHKGEIWVESEGEGKGSTFFVAMPIGK